MEEAPDLSRPMKLRKIAEDLSAGELLTIAEARYTLEADLLEPFATNEEVMAEAFMRQKPRSGAFWATVVASESPPLTFYQKLRSTKRFIGKGEFAHDIASLIRSGKTFSCRNYSA